MAVSKKPALGRGLDSLLGTDALEKAAERSAESFPLDKLDPNPDQPRRSFGGQSLEELAQSLRELVDHYGITQEELAAHLGWSRSAVTNKLRLLALPEVVHSSLAGGAISEGHARALLSLEDTKQMEELLSECLKFSWPVRTLENRVKALKNRQQTSPKNEMVKWRPASALKFSRRLGISLSVTGHGQQNKVVLRGLTRDQVNALCDLLAREYQALKAPKENSQ